MTAFGRGYWEGYRDGLRAARAFMDGQLEAAAVFAVQEAEREVGSQQTEEKKTNA